MFENYQNGDSDIASVNLSEDIKNLQEKIKDRNNPKKKEKKKEVKDNIAEEEQFESFDEFQEKRKDSGNESEIRLDENVEKEIVEPLLDIFIDYSNDVLSNLYQVIFEIR